MAWKITVDWLAEEGERSRVGVCSHDWSYDAEAANPKYAPCLFELRDDDGNAYYRGRSTKPDDFSPLDDFGMPDAGCTEILYRQADGTWETL